MRKVISHLKENWIKYGFETFVVVVGILGAYSLNNWNETVNKNRVEKQILKELREEFSNNKILLQTVYDRHEQGINQIVDLLKLYHTPFNNVDSNDLDSLVKWSMINSAFVTYDPSLGFLKSVISSGKLGIISNEDLVILLSQFEDKVKDANEGVLLIRQLWVNQTSQVFKNYTRWNDPRKINSRFKSDFTGFFVDPDVEFWLRHIGKYLEVELEEEGDVLSDIDQILSIIDRELGI
jgi:hypothetical protein